jgi:DNA polymerase-3 subunit delta
VSSIYLLHGTEAILMDEWIDLLIDQYLPDGKDDLNYSLFNLDEVSVQHVIQQAETIPFMGDYRIIIAEYADFFGSINSKQAHDIDMLNNFILNPPSYSKIIFRTSLEKLDKRKKITKQFEKLDAIIAFNQLQGRQLDEWVVKRVKKYNCDIDADAIYQLVYAVGSNLTLLVNEIDKLCLYVNKGRITKNEVKLLVTRTLEQNIFLVIDKIAQKKINQGLQIVYDLVKNKESPILLLFLLAKKFRMMLICKELSEKGYSSQQIANQTNQHPYTIKITMEQGNSFSKNNLREIIKSLAVADEHIKTGQMTELVALEKFILTIPK